MKRESNFPSNLRKSNITYHNFFHVTMHHNFTLCRKNNFLQNFAQACSIKYSKCYSKNKYNGYK